MPTLRKDGELAKTKASPSVLDLAGRGLQRIDPLPEGISPQTLILENNNIAKIENLQYFAHLQQLSLACNRLTHMNGITLAQGLRVLDLSNNDIGVIEGLSFLRGLEWLNVSGNSIKKIENLNKNTNLVHLDLSDNSVTMLSDLTTLSRLKTLLLHGNLLSSLRSCAAQLPPNVHTLSLAANEITDLNEVAFLSSLPNLEQLSIANNPCTVNPSNRSSIDFRPFVVCYCQRVRNLDGHLVTHDERTKAEYLRREDQLRFFTPGQHRQLVMYLSQIDHLNSSLHDKKPRSFSGASKNQRPMTAVIDGYYGNGSNYEEDKRKRWSMPAYGEGLPYQHSSTAGQHRSNNHDNKYTQQAPGYHDNITSQQAFGHEATGFYSDEGHPLVHESKRRPLSFVEQTADCRYVDSYQTSQPQRWSVQEVPDYHDAWSRSYSSDEQKRWSSPVLDQGRKSSAAADLTLEEMHSLTDEADEEQLESESISIPFSSTSPQTLKGVEDYDLPSSTLSMLSWHQSLVEEENRDGHFVRNSRTSTINGGQLSIDTSSNGGPTGFSSTTKVEDRAAKPAYAQVGVTSHSLTASGVSDQGVNARMFSSWQPDEATRKNASRYSSDRRQLGGEQGGAYLQESIYEINHSRSMAKETKREQKIPSGSAIHSYREEEHFETDSSRSESVHTRGSSARRDKEQSDLQQSISSDKKTKRNFNGETDAAFQPTGVYGNGVSLQPKVEQESLDDPVKTSASVHQVEQLPAREDESLAAHLAANTVTGTSSTSTLTPESTSNSSSTLRPDYEYNGVGSSSTLRPDYQYNGSACDYERTSEELEFYDDGVEAPVMTKKEAIQLINLAATIVQAHVRGFLVRKKLDLWDLRRRNQAAAVIQAGWKGYYARTYDIRVVSARQKLKLQRLQEYVNHIARLFQRYREENDLEKHKMLEVIQAMWMENHRRVVKERTRAAVTIQSHWRAYCVRKAHPILRWKTHARTRSLAKFCQQLQDQINLLSVQMRAISGGKESITTPERVSSPVRRRSPNFRHRAGSRDTVESDTTESETSAVEPCDRRKNTIEDFLDGEIDLEVTLKARSSSAEEDDLNNSITDKKKAFLANSVPDILITSPTDRSSISSEGSSYSDYKYEGSEEIKPKVLVNDAKEQSTEQGVDPGDAQVAPDMNLRNEDTPEDVAGDSTEKDTENSGNRLVETTSEADLPKYGLDNDRSTDSFEESITGDKALVTSADYQVVMMESGGSSSSSSDNEQLRRGVYPLSSTSELDLFEKTEAALNDPDLSDASTVAAAILSSKEKKKSHKKVKDLEEQEIETELQGKSDGNNYQGGEGEYSDATEQCVLSEKIAPVSKEQTMNVSSIPNAVINGHKEELEQMECTVALSHSDDRPVDKSNSWLLSDSAEENSLLETMESEESDTSLPHSSSLPSFILSQVKERDMARSHSLDSLQTLQSAGSVRDNRAESLAKFSGKVKALSPRSGSPLGHRAAALLSELQSQIASFSPERRAEPGSVTVPVRRFTEPSITVDLLPPTPPNSLSHVTQSTVSHVDESIVTQSTVPYTDGSVHSKDSHTACMSDQGLCDNGSPMPVAPSEKDSFTDDNSRDSNNNGAVEAKPDTDLAGVSHSDHSKSSLEQVNRECSRSSSSVEGRNQTLSDDSVSDLSDLLQDIASEPNSTLSTEVEDVPMDVLRGKGTRLFDESLEGRTSPTADSKPSFSMPLFEDIDRTSFSLEESVDFLRNSREVTEESD